MNVTATIPIADQNMRCVHDRRFFMAQNTAPKLRAAQIVTNAIRHGFIDIDSWPVDAPAKVLPDVSSNATR
jgi:hypothetical protein